MSTATSRIAAATAIVGLGTLGLAYHGPAMAHQLGALLPVAAPVSAPAVVPAAPAAAVGLPAEDAKRAKVVYLTFDDGPDPRNTPQVLELLKRYDAKATFFMIGAAAKTHPALVQQVRAEGHLLANHTYTHPWLNRVSPAVISDQLRRTDTVLGRTACVRPPGGFVSASVHSIARREGKKIVMWTVDPKDWTRPGAAAITNRVMKATRPGGIVLLHDGGGARPQTVSALGVLLARLSAAGYRFETVPACRLAAT